MDKGLVGPRVSDEVWCLWDLEYPCPKWEVFFSRPLKLRAHGNGTRLALPFKLVYASSKIIIYLELC